MEERKLRDELALHRGETVYIGARSSFFFIGPAEEALANLPLISAVLNASDKHWQIDKSEGEKLGRRKVLKVYQNDILGGGIVILVEGSEFGMFWTRLEYLEERDRLLRIFHGTTSQNPASEKGLIRDLRRQRLDLRRTSPHKGCRELKEKGARQCAIGNGMDVPAYITATPMFKTTSPT